jgi:predicted AAA+ superfamily ATPase
MYISRSIEPLVAKALFQGKVVIIYGPRQVGKTTLVKRVLSDLQLSYLYLNCDEDVTRKLFSGSESSIRLKEIIGEHKVVVIDEAQRVRNIGLKLKILVDNFPHQQIIATGSSSFELANEIVEPLTGRNTSFWLYPFSLKELSTIWDKFTLLQNFENLLIFGSYPRVVLASSKEERIATLRELAGDSLYKDVLKFQSLKSSEMVQKLLAALALQIGGEVSFSEVGRLIEISKQTAHLYTEILERAFVVFKALPFSRNLRKEIGKTRKVYFLDNGIRNSLIGNLNQISLRSDIGALWENFVVSEVKKKQYDIVNSHNLHFWRTYDQQEIDLIEDYDGKLHATEIKWQKLKKQPPKAWREHYPGSRFRAISKDNFLEYLL